MNIRRVVFAFSLMSSILFGSTGVAIADESGRRDLQRASQEMLNTEIFLDLRCIGNGTFAWNVTVTDGRRNSTYTMRYLASYQTFDGNGGGDFGDPKWGSKIPTGTYGTGSSSTIYSGDGLRYYEVEVFVENFRAKRSATC